MCLAQEPQRSDAGEARIIIIMIIIIILIIIIMIIIIIIVSYCIVCAYVQEDNPRVLESGLSTVHTYCTSTHVVAICTHCITQRCNNDNNNNYPYARTLTTPASR